MDVEVSADTPLLEAGLTSLDATELIAVLAQRLGMKLSATMVFDYPTVPAIAGFVASEALAGATDEAATLTAFVPREVSTDTQLAIVGAALRFPSQSKSMADLWN